MEDLETRKEYRKEQKKLLANGGVIGDGDVVNVNQSPNANAEATTDDKYENMTVAQLKAAASELGTDVPKDITLRDDVLNYVRNLAKFKESQTDNAGLATDNPWNAAQ